MIHDTQVLDTPVPQYVDIPSNLTAHPYLAPLPAPFYTADRCQGFGCYSNDQLANALSGALAGYGKCTGQLDQIGGLSSTAVKTNPH